MLAFCLVCAVPQIKRFKAERDDARAKAASATASAASNVATASEPMKFDASGRSMDHDHGHGHGGGDGDPATATSPTTVTSAAAAAAAEASNVLVGSLASLLAATRALRGGCANVGSGIAFAVRFAQTSQAAASRAVGTACGGAMRDDGGAVADAPTRSLGGRAWQLVRRPRELRSSSTGGGFSSLTTVAASSEGGCSEGALEGASEGASEGVVWLVLAPVAVDVNGAAVAGALVHPTHTIHALRDAPATALTSTPTGSPVAEAAQAVTAEAAAGEAAVAGRAAAARAVAPVAAEAAAAAGAVGSMGGGGGGSGGSSDHEGRVQTQVVEARLAAALSAFLSLTCGGEADRKALRLEVRIKGAGHHTAKLCLSWETRKGSGAPPTRPQAGHCATGFALLWRTQRALFLASPLHDGACVYTCGRACVYIATCTTKGKVAPESARGAARRPWRVPRALCQPSGATAVGYTAVRGTTRGDNTVGAADDGNGRLFSTAARTTIFGTGIGIGGSGSSVSSGHIVRSLNSVGADPTVRWGPAARDGGRRPRGYSHANGAAPAAEVTSGGPTFLLIVVALALVLIVEVGGRPNGRQQGGATRGVAGEPHARGLSSPG